MATPSASEKSVAPIVVPGQLTLRTIRGKNGRREIAGLEIYPDEQSVNR